MQEESGKGRVKAAVWEKQTARTHPMTIPDASKSHGWVDRAIQASRPSSARRCPHKALCRSLFALETARPSFLRTPAKSGPSMSPTVFSSCCQELNSTSLGGDRACVPQVSAEPCSTTGLPWAHHRRLWLWKAQQRIVAQLSASACSIFDLKLRSSSSSDFTLRHCLFFGFSGVDSGVTSELDAGFFFLLLCCSISCKPATYPASHV